MSLVPITLYILIYHYIHHQTTAKAKHLRVIVTTLKFKRIIYIYTSILITYYSKGSLG